jgi:hypothetical protein
VTSAPLDDDWVRTVRALHDAQFGEPWQERVDRLNANFRLSGRYELRLPHRRLPPAWFSGDIEHLPEHDWVLVVSLNPHIDPADVSLHAREFTEQAWWDYWRDFNRHQEQLEGAVLSHLRPPRCGLLGRTRAE